MFLGQKVIEQPLDDMLVVKRLLQLMELQRGRRQAIRKLITWVDERGIDDTAQATRLDGQPLTNGGNEALKLLRCDPQKGTCTHRFISGIEPILALDLL